MQRKKFGLVITFLVTICVTLISQENRSITGEGNNFNNPVWGAAESMLPRATTVNYLDGISTVNNLNLKSERVISNSIFAQEEKVNNTMQLSDYVWAFGQFLDHDISLVENSTDLNERIFINVPNDDEFFTAMPGLFRSKAIEGTGTSVDNPRQYANAVTSFIDGSMIYGSDEVRAEWLRTGREGKLKMSLDGTFLPWNTTSTEFNADFDPTAPHMELGGAPNPEALLFVAGDVRANENPVLCALHVLFVKEHNRMCDEILQRHPDWAHDDEKIYQRARKYIGAYLQAITYNEWLPAMGIEIPSYSGYRPDVNPGVSNVFSAAAFRLGHTLINSEIVRMDNNGDVFKDGNLGLKESFFDPRSVYLTNSIDPFLKGMATQEHQDLDCKVIDDLRNFLFDASGTGTLGFDLVSINIARGRERGLPDYNTVRIDFGLPPVNSFANINSDPNVVAELEDIYESVDEIDAWVGMLSETHMNEEILFGELVNKILEDQFQSLRDGDRFFFENDAAFSESDKIRIRSTTMHDIIMRNSDIEIMQDNVFTAMDHTDIPNGPELEEIQLTTAVYPNPIDENTVLKVYAEYDSDAQIIVYNMIGQIIEQFSTPLYRGDNIISLNLPKLLNPGIYSITLSAGEAFTAIKVVKE